jgi:hypothetical protein
LGPGWSGGSGAGVTADGGVALARAVLGVVLAAVVGADEAVPPLQADATIAATPISIINARGRDRELFTLCLLLVARSVDLPPHRGLGW